MADGALVDIGRLGLVPVCCRRAVTSKHLPSPIEKKHEPVGLRFRPSLKRALDHLAAADRRPLATYIELVLEDHVERSGKPAGKRK
jgi:hypothetical protein